MCVCTHTHVCTFIIYVCMYIYVCTFIIYMYMYVHLSYMYVCTYLFIYVRLYVHSTNVHLVQISVQSTLACSSALCTNYINTGDAAAYNKKNIDFNHHFILNWHFVITQKHLSYSDRATNPSECCFIIPNMCVTLLNSQL